MKTRALILTLLVLFSAAVARAGQDPDQLKGFTPDGVFHFLGLDNVNMFSGNLVLTIPIGGEYPIASGLTYRFNLVCNGNLWDSEVADGLCHHKAPGYPNDCKPVKAIPDRRANAGMGCLLTLGRLYPPQHVTTSRATPRWVYEAPDASEHYFEPNADGNEYTTDASYLRMRVVDGQRWIEFPDGTIHKFAPSGSPTADVWNLVEITNQFPANWLRIDYSTALQWNITDNHGRSHKIGFLNQDVDGSTIPMVDTIELEAASTEGAVPSQIGTDGRVKYTIEYTPDEFTLAVPYWDTDADDKIGSNDLIQVPLLKKITQPDGTTYELDHLNNWSLGTSGLVYKMRIPTRNCIAWDWGWWSKPQPSEDEMPFLQGSHGIRRRILMDSSCPDPFDENVTGLGVWTYIPDLTEEAPDSPPCDPIEPGQQPRGCESERELQVTVRDPLGHAVKHYFSVAPHEVEGWRIAEYGAPFTRYNPYSDGMFLSKETFDCPRNTTTNECIANSTAFGTRLRREFVVYESDNGDPPYFFNHGDPFRRNTRLLKSRTVYDDDGGRTVLSSNLNFDRYQYKTVKQEGFTDGALVRTTTTNFTPHVTSSKWLLQLYDSKTVTEGTEVDKAYFRFNTANGTLAASRLPSGNCTGELCGDDVLTVFGYDSHGNATSTKSYGGHNGTLGTNACCDDPGGTPTYVTRNVYAYGVLSRTDVLDPTACGDPETCPTWLETADFTIDQATGLVTQSRDAADYTTTYEYDAFGRTIRQRPVGRAWTEAVYTPASTGSRASVSIKRYENGSSNTSTPLSAMRYDFDDLGRPVSESITMPGGVESRRDTTFNILGWKTAVSELGTGASLPSTVTQFDAFGRPLSVKAPDQSLTKFLYSGVRQTTRISKIATSLGDRDATTTEVYDAFGRLTEVIEQSGPTTASDPLGDPITTRYTYDNSDRLTKVEVNADAADVQTRTFEYDGRGFLERETHPESGTTSYTYDARGHVLTKNAEGDAFDLEYDYDKAERLTHVRQGTTLYKKFEFGTGTLSGRLWKATRWNHPRTGITEPIVRVREVYDYRDAAGRQTHRTTYVDEVAGTTDGEIGTPVIDPITQSVAYNGLNQELAVTYPVCKNCGRPEDLNRTVSSTYNYGRVYSVTGFVTSTTYGENGMWTERLHNNGVLEKQTPDPNKMQRPLAIAAYGVTDCPTITAQPVDVTIQPNQNATFTIASADPGATFQWYQGVAPNGTLIEGATSATLTVQNLTTTTAYYCVVTAAAGTGTCQATSVTVRANVCEGLQILTEPDPTEYVIKETELLRASVAVSATTVSYQWRLIHLAHPNGDTNGLDAPERLDSINHEVAVYAPKPGKWGLEAMVGTDCHGITTAAKVMAKKFIVEDAGEEEEETLCKVALLTSFPSTIKLSISRPTVYLELYTEPKSEHTVRWYVDGKYRKTGETLAAAVDKGIAVMATIDRDCGGGKIAQTEIKTAWVFKPENCPVPPITVDRDLIDQSDTDSPGFTVSSPWQHLIFSWYEGDSGNTRHLIRRDVNVGTSTYIPPRNVAGTYWVRAESGCGTYTDSETLRVATSPSCTPIEFLTQPQNAEINAGAAHTLTWQTTAMPIIHSQRWYQETAGADMNANQRSKTVYPRITTRYRVTATANNCHTASSAVATVRVTSCTNITVVTPPLSQSIKKGEEVELSIDAFPAISSLGSLSYEWYRGEPGDYGQPFATTATIREKPEVDTKYWVRVRLGNPNDGGCAIDKVATVTVCDPAKINVDPFGSVVPAGYRQYIGVDAVGTHLQYQWYVGEQGDMSNPITLGDMPELFVAPNVTTDYWVRVYNDCGDARSRHAKISIEPKNLSTLTGDRVTKGATRTLTINAEGTQLRYQWHAGNDDTQPIAGQTQKTFTTPPINGEVTYWVRVWSGDAWVDSNSATFTICQPPNVLQTGSSNTSGGESMLYVENAEQDAVYEWYEGQTGNTAKLLRIGSTLTIAPLTSTDYWVRTKWPTCSADSPTIAIVVCRPRITTQPAGDMINSGQTKRLTVAATGNAPLSYKWYEGAVGDTSKLVGTGQEFTTPALTSPTTYWVRVSNPANCGVTHIDSTAATITICKPPAINSHPVSTVSSAGVGVRLAVWAVGDGLSYRWYRGVSGDLANSVDLNHTATELLVYPLQTVEYWVRVTGTCGTANSTTARISIPPSISAQPQGALATKGTSKTVSVSASGTMLSYQWYYGSAGVTTNPIAGATGPSCNTGALNATTSVWVRVFSGDASTDSEAATFTVCQAPPISINQANSMSGSSVYLSVTPATGETYNWYQGASGTTTTPIGTGTNITVTPKVTTDYWVRSTRTECTADGPTTRVQICAPRITAHPAGTMVNPNATMTLSVTAEGDGPFSYQWYKGDSGVTTNPISGATGASYTTEAMTADTKYWVRVSSPANGACATRSANSTATTVSVCKVPAISTHPASLNGTSNVNHTLSVTATGTDLTYQWYRGQSGDMSSPVSNATSNTASLTIAQTQTTWYWVRISGRCGTPVNSNAARISIPPVITAHPAGGAVTKNATRTISVTATGTELRYEWRRADDSIITGATSSSYTTPPITSDTSYTAVVYSADRPERSNAAVFTVCQPRSVTYSQPTNNAGSAVTLQIVNPTAGETYEWYQGASGNTSAYLGTGTTWPVNPVGSTYYWARTKRSTCDADSDAVLVAVCRPTINVQPASTTINAGNTATLRVTATGTGLTYQWYEGPVGYTTTLLGTGDSYTTQVLNSTKTYWVRVNQSLQAGCSPGSADSTLATVTVCNPANITVEPQPNWVSSTGSVSLSVTASGSVNRYQWYEGQTGDTSKPVGTNNRILTITPGTTKYYWVRVFDSCGTYDDSVSALQSVFPIINAEPQDMNVCPGTVNVTVSASGTQLSYQWYRRLESSQTWEAIGTNSPTLALDLTANQYVYCKVTSGTAYTQTRQAYLTVASAPVIYGIQKYRTSFGLYYLTPTLADSWDVVSVAWYRGALGDRTYFQTNQGTLGTYDYGNYWVEVAYNDTGCASRMAVAVP